MLALVLAPVLTFVSPSPPPAPCNLPQTTRTAQQAPALRVRKLGDLPDADMDLAVIRTVDGCAMRQVVRFHVSDPASTAGETGLSVPGLKGTLAPQGPAQRRTRPVR